MNEDDTTISAVHRLGEAISYACGGRYESVISCVADAMRDLEMLRDKYELDLAI